MGQQAIILALVLIYVHSMIVQAVKALTRLHQCAGSSESSSLLEYAIKAQIPYTGSPDQSLLKCKSNLEFLSLIEVKLRKANKTAQHGMHVQIWLSISLLRLGVMMLLESMFCKSCHSIF